MSLNIPCPNAIDSLLSRRSVKARTLVAPGPDAQALGQILEAGRRVPDHGKLAPWRFFVFEGAARRAFGEQIANCYVSETKNPSDVIARGFIDFTVQAPLLIVLASTPSDDRPIPHFEQQLSAGASGMAMLIAANLLGYAGNWLTGWAASSDGVKRSLGLGAGDRIAGFLFFGAAPAEPEERPRPDPEQVVRHFRSAADFLGKD